MFKTEPSFEVLAWQRDSQLAPRMTQLFQQVIDNGQDEIVVRKSLQEICDLIFEQTGLTFEFRIVEKSWFFGPLEISVKLPNLNAISPINKKAVERLRKFDVQNMTVYDLIDGTIDYKHGRVSGFFSKLVHDIAFSKATFSGAVPAAELTAATLHEVGHGWTNCVFLGESLGTNIIVAELVGQYEYQDTARKKFEVGKAAMKLAGVDQEDIKDTADLTAVVLKGTVQRMQVNAGTRWYDSRLTETLADQFVVKYGIGVDLVKALTRFERSTHLWADVGYEPKWIGLLFNFANIVMLPFDTAAGVFKPVLSKMLKQTAKSFSFSFFMSGFLSEVAKRVRDSGHAPLKDRIQTIRRDMVAELRQPNLEDDRRKQILADLQLVDEEAGGAHPFTDVYSVVSKWITNVAVGRASELGHHTLVDDLANNRLYEFSAQLKG